MLKSSTSLGLKLYPTVVNRVPNAFTESNSIIFFYDFDERIVGFKPFPFRVVRYEQRIKLVPDSLSSKLISYSVSS